MPLLLAYIIIFSYPICSVPVRPPVSASIVAPTVEERQSDSKQVINVIVTTRVNNNIATMSMISTTRTKVTNKHHKHNTKIDDRRSCAQKEGRNTET